MVVVSLMLFVSVPHAPIGISATQTDECGIWKWDGPREEKDLRIKTTVIVGSSGGDCHGVFRLKNDTGVWGFGGGYSLELRSRSENANVVWRPPPNVGSQSVLLTPLIDVELHSTPLNRTSDAQVFVTGDMTLYTVAVDTSIFLVKTALALAPLGLECWVPEEQILLTGIRLSNILMTVTELALRGDFEGARRELLQIGAHFYERSASVIVELGIDCAAEIFKGVANRPVVIAKIALAYLTWVPIVIYDYIKYQGQSANVLVVYTAQKAPQPTPIIAGITGPCGTPGYDTCADIGDPTDEAFHNLTGWGQNEIGGPIIPPSGDPSKRYQPLRRESSVRLKVPQPNIPYTLYTEVEDGDCDDSWAIYVDGQGPVYTYYARPLINTGLVHQVVIPASFIQDTTVIITFRNLASDSCGLAAVFYVKLQGGQSPF